MARGQQECRCGEALQERGERHHHRTCTGGEIYQSSGRQLGGKSRARTVILIFGTFGTRLHEVDKRLLHLNTSLCMDFLRTKYNVQGRERRTRKEKSAAQDCAACKNFRREKRVGHLCVLIR